MTVKTRCHLDRGHEGPHCGPNPYSGVQEEWEATGERDAPDVIGRAKLYRVRTPRGQEYTEQSVRSFDALIEGHRGTLAKHEAVREKLIATRETLADAQPI